MGGDGKGFGGSDCLILSPSTVGVFLFFYGLNGVWNRGRVEFVN